MQVFWTYLMILFIASYSLSTRALGNMSFRVTLLLSSAVTRSLSVAREDLVANTSTCRNLFKVLASIHSVKEHNLTSIVY